MDSKHVKNDDWLSGIIQKKAYALVVDDAFIDAVKDERSEEYRWLQSIRNEPSFTYTKILPSDVAYIEFIEKLGFRLIETNVTFRKPVEHIEHFEVEGKEHEVRFAGPEDREGTVDVARRSFIYSRFHVDSRFPRELANEVKAQWVASYFKGKRGDKMAIATIGEKVIGFLQLLRNGTESWVIDLIAVDRDYGRRGAAADMIRFAEAYYKGFQYVLVGTQIANMPSIRLYQKLGFALDSAKYVFHYHK
jgi:ribosomal protein S18 acetylase RimI-like enzyme